MPTEQRAELNRLKLNGMKLNGARLKTTTVPLTDDERRVSIRDGRMGWVQASGDRVGSIAVSTMRTTAGVVVAGAVVVGSVVGAVVLGFAGEAVAAPTTAISLAADVAPGPMSFATVLLAASGTTATTPTTSPPTGAKPASTTATDGTSTTTQRPAVSQGQVFAALFLVLVAAAWMVYRNRSTRDDIGDASRDDFGGQP